MTSYLFFGLCLLYIVSSHFDSWGKDSSGELHNIHSKQVAELLRRWECKDTGSIKLIRLRTILHVQLQICSFYGFLDLDLSLMEVSNIVFCIRNETTKPENNAG